MKFQFVHLYFCKKVGNGFHHSCSRFRESKRLQEKMIKISFKNHYVLPAATRDHLWIAKAFLFYGLPIPIPIRLQIKWKYLERLKVLRFDDF